MEGRKGLEWREERGEWRYKTELVKPSMMLVVVCLFFFDVFFLLFFSYTVQVVYILIFTVHYCTSTVYFNFYKSNSSSIIRGKERNAMSNQFSGNLSESLKFEGSLPLRIAKEDSEPVLIAFESLKSVFSMTVGFEGD